MTPSKHDTEPVMPQLEGFISTRHLRTFLREWRTWRATVATREKADDEEFLRVVTHTVRRSRVPMPAEQREGPAPRDKVDLQGSRQRQSSRTRHDYAALSGRL